MATLIQKLGDRIRYIWAYNIMGPLNLTHTHKSNTFHISQTVRFRPSSKELLTSFKVELFIRFIMNSLRLM